MKPPKCYYCGKEPIKFGPNVTLCFTFHQWSQDGKGDKVLLSELPVASAKQKFGICDNCVREIYDIVIKDLEKFTEAKGKIQV